jgi:uncharacterized phage-associated protein
MKILKTFCIKMKYTVNQIANFFLSKIDIQKGDSITPLKLQKLVYYAQAWHYTIFEIPLFDDKIEAWAHGPVVRVLWDRFKNISRDSLIDVSSITIENDDISIETTKLLDEVNRIYGEHSGSYLEALTHSEMPWKAARKNLPIHSGSNTEIKLSDMKTYYSKLRDEKR